MAGLTLTDGIAFLLSHGPVPGSALDPASVDACAVHV